MDVPIAKLDVVTYSWQKVLGGEAQHGVLILSPRAVERLETYQPPWPLPKIFRMTKGGKFMEAIFKADTINTPSMLCVEDALDGLKWAEPRSVACRNWCGAARPIWPRWPPGWSAPPGWTSWPRTRPPVRAPPSASRSSIRGSLGWRRKNRAQSVEEGRLLFLEAEGVAYDIAPYREAPPGIRLWGGATVERSDLEALFPWLDWAYAEVKGG